MTKSTVFFSYSHTDSEWMKEFKKALVNNGVNVWDVDEIRPGEPWKEKIEKGLRESEILVTMIDENNVNSPWVFFELGAAIGMRKKIVAIIPKNFETSQLPEDLRFSLITESPEMAADEIVEELNSSQSSRENIESFKDADNYQNQIAKEINELKQKLKKSNKQNKLLCYLIEGTRGGKTRALLLRHLADRSNNAYQLAKDLNLDYKTVRHHLSVLTKNGIIKAEEDKDFNTIYSINNKDYLKEFL